MAELLLEHVSKRYGEHLVVADVSLAIPQGEFLVLLGPSGCGKTTTLRMIAGFIEPSAGTIKLGGNDVTKLPPWKRNTGLVFQSYALFPHLTVDENVAFGLEMRKVPAAEMRSRVAEALRLVRLDDYGERLPRQLSGGQQQRVALARALAFRPDVLLLDEPLSNLDAKLRAEVRVEIRELQQKLGLTTVMVTHDQDEALSMADRLAVMANGVVQQVGTQRDLYERPSGRFVAGFVGRSNFLEGNIAEPGFFTSAGGLRIVCATPFLGKATLAIRPEAVSIGPEADRLDNRFQGVVEYISYLGAILDVRVMLTPQDRVIVQIANRIGGQPPTPGETLAIGWPKGAGQVFSSEEIPAKSGAEADDA
jgi:putative spermidine/putrescine transport system ATP-binding protein